jgi:hypothetical protein
MQSCYQNCTWFRSKLVKILIVCSGLCVKGITTAEFENNSMIFTKMVLMVSIKYPISFEKLIRMYKNVLANGFTSYAKHKEIWS